MLRQERQEQQEQIERFWREVGQELAAWTRQAREEQEGLVPCWVEEDEQRQWCCCY